MLFARAIPFWVRTALTTLSGDANAPVCDAAAAAPATLLPALRIAIGLLPATRMS